MFKLRCVGLLAIAAAMGGCPGTGTVQRNPFLTVTENFGTSIFGDDGQDGGGTGTAAEAEFRRTFTLTLANNDVNGELNTSWMAWVNTSSIHSAAQQDALLSNGYIQLTREVTLGTAFALPPGTFVYNGAGKGGATVVRIDQGIPGAADDDPATPTELAFADIITPDVLLIFSQPPVSCDTPAFYFTLDGQALDIAPNPDQLGAAFGGATSDGAVKTLAQFDVYECSPLRPGLFLKSAGGARADNEFFEGQNIRVDFFRIAGADDLAAYVTISDELITTTTEGSGEPPP